MALNITPSSISSSLAIGHHWIVGKYVITVYINNSDVTSATLWESTSITDSLGNIKGLTLRGLEAMAAVKNDELTIIDTRVADKKIFGGFIKEVTKKFQKKDFFKYDLLVQDYTRLVDESTGVTADYSDGYPEGIIINLLIILFVPGIKYSWDYIMMGETISINFADKTARQAFDEVAEAGQLADILDVQRVWYIDYNRYMHYFKLGDEMAPWELSDASDESTTFKYTDLEVTEDVVNSEVRGSLKCWKEGLFAGMSVKITNAKLGWSSETYLVYEVTANLIAGDMYTDPVFEYEVAFGSYPRRVTDRIPPPDDGEGGAEVKSRYPGSTTANWFTGHATSGLLGADCLTFGTAGAIMSIHSLSISTTNLTPGASLNVRMYHQVNGDVKKFFDDYFTVGTDPEDLLPITGEMSFYDVTRVEIQSNKVGDDGKEIDWEYILGSS